ncbi:hypothetical protein B0H13DRAFT_1897681 [Mycena leptocephala]|nr:hypothetical protein B0H13DRAFT_1897681 [Mycena leptocephala]
MAEEFGHSVEPARMPPIGSEYGRNKNPYVPRRDINNSHLCAQPLFPMERATARARSTTGEFEAQHVTPPVALPQLSLSKGLPVLEIDPAALERWFHTGDMSCEDQDTGEGEDADRRIK